MTLYRQLLLFGLSTIILLCIGLWAGELQRTRQFLVAQLESHAQDTATSLGLSLSTLAHGTDAAVMESMINALFDRGYYRLIQFKDVQGSILINRQAPVTIEHVPAWFIQAVPLAIPSAQAMVMHGWKQTGTVTVESHPGYAYYTLWQAVQSASLWFAIAAAVVIVAGGFRMRRLLAPLAQVEKQALALCDRRFHIQERLPRTRELRRVVVAMNQMTERVREMFKEQASLADTLQQRAYQDQLTGLGNRRFLEAQVKAKVAAKDTPVTGTFLLFQIQGLQSINQQLGYTIGDQLISELASGLQKSAVEQPEAIIGRLGGGDLALLLPNTDADTAADLAETLLKGLDLVKIASAPATVACGGVSYSRPTSFNELLLHADTALNTARLEGASESAAIFPLDDATTVAVGRTEWKHLLETVLANRSLILYSQPTVSREDRDTVTHHEMLSRIPGSNGRHISAGTFLPMAEQLGLMPALDRLILENVIALPPSRLIPPRVAINLSPVSLENEAFTDWLFPQLSRCAASGLLLNFEFSEFRAIRHFNRIRTFADRIRPMGHGIGIDHFGQGLTHYGYLKSLIPDYVKIHRAITNEMHSDQDDTSFFVSTLCTVAHSLDIRVIIEGVETEQQWRTVTALPIDAVQGYFIRRPEPIL
ncbi:MAG: EAL domain-containing protein [Desulfobulbus sp.]|nr:EAL domain-containing protein [Desulfobulbus sp.]